MNSKITALISSMRPLQWTKNGFIFIPALFSGVLFSPEVEIKALIMFTLFCFVSGGVYLTNDIFDLESDRNHPLKKKRPLASGLISTKFASISTFVLQIGSLSISYLYLGSGVAFILFIYIITNLFYSAGLKNVVILDAFIVSNGFILRIIAGTLITEIPPSPWILLTPYSWLYLSLSENVGANYQV